MKASSYDGHSWSSTNSESATKYQKGENDEHKNAKFIITKLAQECGWGVEDERPLEIRARFTDTGEEEKHKYKIDLVLEKKAGTGFTHKIAVELDGDYHFASQKANNKTNRKAEWLDMLARGEHDDQDVETCRLITEFCSFKVEEVYGGSALSLKQIRQRLGLGLPIPLVH